MAFYTALFRLDSLASLGDVEVRINRTRISDVPVDNLLWPPQELLQRRWVALENIPLQANEVRFGDAASMQYIATRARIERAKWKSYWYDSNGGLVEKSERVNVIECDVAFFSWENKVYGMLFSKADYVQNRVMKDMFDEKQWGSLSLNLAEYSIPSEVFYWMFRAFKFGDKVLSEEPEIRIDGVSGYHGHLHGDKSHTLKGDGERIYDVLSTMSFLFSNEYIDSLKLTVLTIDSEYTFVLHNNGSLEVFEEDCRSPRLEGKTGLLRNLILTHTLYGDILPTIIRSFAAANDSGFWNEVHKDALTTIIGYQILSEVSATLGLNDDLTVKQIRSGLKEKLSSELESTA